MGSDAVRGGLVRAFCCVVQGMERRNRNCPNFEGCDGKGRTGQESNSLESADRDMEVDFGTQARHLAG